MNTDIITHLPGYSGKLRSKLYGGYIPLNNNKNTYYIFIEAETNPKNAPILFWTNGGPGCSGLMGLFEEFGPYRPTKNGKLNYNSWTWTKFANIVFIEQPIGVGFSWSTDKTDYISNDDKSAKDNLAFLLQFFHKYPEFKSNNLYLTSESYGGHYIPLWANEIVNYNKMNNNTIKLKGLMIGNPYIDFVSGTETQIESYWGHQKLPLELWEKFRKNKCIISYNKNLKKTLKKKKCNQLSNKLISVVGKHNPYAMDYPICISQQQDTLLTYHHQRNKTIKKEYTPCIDNYTVKYLNRSDVQKAIHAKKPRVKWGACSDILKYRSKDSYNSQVELLNTLLNDKDLKYLNVFIMSGTNDTICGTIGTQKWIQQLNIKPKKIWKQHFINNEPAGYISTYLGDKNKKFVFATVNLAGHEIPLYKPQVAYSLMEKFINGKLN